MAFDVAAARRAGYTEAEIADFLGQQDGFDVGAARKAGYDDDELVAHLLTAKPADPSLIERGAEAVRGGIRNAVDYLEADHGAGSPDPGMPGFDYSRFKQGQAEAPARAAADAADIAHSDGFVDTVGDYLSRGSNAVDAGLRRTGSVISDALGLDRQAEQQRTMARAGEAARSTKIEGNVDFDQVKADPLSLNTLKFVGQGGIESLPGMAAAAMSLPFYAVTQAGSIGQQRAENDGRADATFGDVVKAAPAAAVSAALERTGIEGILEGTGKNILTRTGKAALVEGATETGQSGVEYLGSNLGTKKGVDAGELRDQMIAGGLVGAAVGGALHGGVEAGSAPFVRESFIDPATGNLEVVINPDPETPAQAVTLTPDDQTSPLPNDLLAVGRAITQAALNPSEPVAPVAPQAAEPAPIATPPAAPALEPVFSDADDSQQIGWFDPRSGAFTQLDNSTGAAPTEAAPVASTSAPVGTVPVPSEMEESALIGETPPVSQQIAPDPPEIAAMAPALAAPIEPVSSPDKLAAAPSVSAPIAAPAAPAQSSSDPLQLPAAAALPAVEPVAQSAAPTGDGSRAAPIAVRSAADLEPVAARVAEPTEAQAKAGNYQKAHLNVQGLDVAIENAKGSTRSGVDPDGKPWSVEMPDHYGYVKGTVGADGDQVDVYIGPQPDAPTVFVVDQVDAATKGWDEHKAMIGYPDQAAALDAYHAAFSDGRGPDRVGAVTPMSMDEFKAWVKTNPTAPVSPVVKTASNSDLVAQQASTPISPANPAVSAIGADQGAEPAPAATKQDALKAKMAAKRSRKSTSRPTPTDTSFNDLAAETRPQSQPTGTQGEQHAAPSEVDDTLNEPPLTEGQRRVETIRDGAFDRAMNRAVARESGADVAPMRRLSVTSRLRRLVADLHDGKLTERRFQFDLEKLLFSQEEKRAEKIVSGVRPRERGADYIRERLLQAKRRGDIGDETADFAEWFIQQNPALLDELGISVRNPPENGRSAGSYNPANRVMTLFKASAADGTAVHEILHHLEQMMPADMQVAIRIEWQKSIAARMKSGDERMRTYLSAALEANGLGTQAAFERAIAVMPDRDAYQYLNPSEFWAINATRILSGRFGMRGSIVGRFRQWVRDVIQHARSALRLRSDAPMLRALSGLVRDGDGRADGEMLTNASQFNDPGKEDAGGVDDRTAKRPTVPGTYRNPTPHEPVAILTGEELGKMPPDPANRIRIMRERAIQWFKGEAGKTVVGRDGVPVLFSAKGQHKSTSGKGEDLLRLVTAIPDIIEKGSIRAMPDKAQGGDPHLRAFRYTGRVDMQGHGYYLAVVAREDANGRRHYDLTWDDGAGTPVLPGGDQGQPRLSLNASGSEGNAGTTGLNLFLTSPDDKAITDPGLYEGLAARLEAVGIKDAVALRIVDTLNGPSGQIHRGIITLAMDGPMAATLDHEIVHALKAAGVFTPTEWSILAKSAAADRSMMASIRERYPDLDEESQIEEAIADRFARRQSGEGVGSGMVHRLLDRMRDIVLAIGRTLRGQGFTTAESVMAAIDRGDVGRREFRSGDDAPRYSIPARGTPSPLGRSSTERDETLAAALFDRARALVQGHADGGKDDAAGSRFDRFRTAMQDRMLPVFRVQDAVARELGRDLAERENAYAGEELMSGKIGAQLERLNSDMVEPLFDAMKAAGVSVSEVEDYLYARHAPERNARIATINKKFASMADRIWDAIEKAPKTKAVERIDKAIKAATKGSNFDLTDAEIAAVRAAIRSEPDSKAVQDLAPVIEDLMATPSSGGSGMNDTEAAEIMAAVERSPRRDAIKAAAARIDAILKFSIDTKVDAGLMSREDADAWRAQYANYVPLRGKAELDPETGVADRPSTGGSGITVRGKESKRALGRKSRATDILAYSIMQAEEAISRAETNRVGQQFGALAKAAPDPDFWAVDKVNRKAVFNSSKGQVEYRSESRIAQEDAPYTVSYKEDGVEHRVTLNRENPAAVRVADAMRNLSAQQLVPLLKYWGIATRTFSALATKWNPEFLITNAMRDIQNASVNLAQHDVPGLIRGTVRDWRAALLAPTDGTGDWGKWRREFEAAGGKVYFSERSDLNTIRKRVEELTAKGDKLSIKTAATAFFGAIDKVNDRVENAVRLSAYKNAREGGMTRAQAASIARNVTVNFTRRGKYGPMINSVVAFFNASVQGSATLAIAAARSKRVRQMLFATVVMGLLADTLNRMSSDDDDDDESYWDKVPAYDKQKNLILMIPGAGDKSIKLPLGLGLNAFFSLGRNISEAFHGRSAADAASEAVGTAVDAFNPVNSSLLGTVLTPVMELKENRNFADKPIYKEQSPFDSPKPNSQTFFPSASTASKTIAEFLNKVSGGDVVLPGKADVSPDVIDYLAGYYTAGAGAFVMRAANLAAAPFDEDRDLTISDIPFARKVVGSKSAWMDKANFYTRTDQVESTFQHAKEYGERDMGTERDAYMAENAPLLQLRGAAAGARKQMSGLRKMRGKLESQRDADLIDAATYRAEKNLIDDREAVVVDQFNARYLAAMPAR